MDGFTAEALIKSAIASGASLEELSRIGGAVNKSQGGADPILVSMEKELIGKEVTIKGTGYTGKIHSINKAESGFYPGSLYPYLVKIDEGNGHASGAIYEYTADQVFFKERTL